MQIPDITTLFLEVRLTLAEALSSLLKKGIKQGIWRSSPDTFYTAYFILDTIECAASRQVIDTTVSQTQLARLEEFLNARLRIENNNKVSRL